MIDVIEIEKEYIIILEIAEGSLEDELKSGKEFSLPEIANYLF